MEVTIRDVAARAQVSFQLVSAVLNNKSYARASAQTREKIELAAYELGYQPNINARILQGGASKLLGVMIDSRAPEETFSLLAELEQVAATHGYRILIAEAHDAPERLFEAYCSLKQNRVDGVISLAHDYPSIDYRLEEKLKAEKKLIFVRRIRDPQHSYVDVDIAGGVAAAVRHLQDEGYRHIGLLCHQVAAPNGQYDQSVEKRFEGFHSVLPDGPVFLVPTPREDMTQLAVALRSLIGREFEAQKIDALIAHNDYCAAILQKELLAAGKRIPEDFGIIGCDNRLICQCLPVELSTITYDRKQMAQKTIEFMIQLIDGTEAPLSTVFEPQLIVRLSSQRRKELP